MLNAASSLYWQSHPVASVLSNAYVGSSYLLRETRRRSPQLDLAGSTSQSSPVLAGFAWTGSVYSNAKLPIPIKIFTEVPEQCLPANTSPPSATPVVILLPAPTMR